MRSYTIIALLLCSSVFFGCSTGGNPGVSNKVNPILGDISYEKKFGTQPQAGANERVRIQTHLEYVENILRSRNAGNMTTEVSAKRNKLLALLHEYRLAANFPANYDYPTERKPCFIDRNGNICAVGYLVEKTAGRKLAEYINKHHQYDKIADMKTPELLAWVENSGLTKEECAMIQPTYGPTPRYMTDNHVSTANGIVSSVWSGANFAFATTSCIQLLKGTPSKKTSFLGVLSGAGQVVYGVLTIPKEQTSWNTTITNNAQKNVSFLNIGVGTASMFLNGLNYFSNKTRSSKNSYGVYSFPAPDNQTGFAFTYTRRL